MLECETEKDKLGHRGPCKFPFTYQNVTHHKCTKQSDVKYWCATRTSDSWHSDGNYGYCDSDCPLEDRTGTGMVDRPDFDSTVRYLFPYTKCGLCRCINTHIYLYLYFVVKSLGCWNEVPAAKAISDSHGVLGIHGCYEQAKSLGNRVFALHKSTESSESAIHGECFTTPQAGDMYKKYGPSNGCVNAHCVGIPNECVNEVYEIENGNS